MISCLPAWPYDSGSIGSSGISSAGPHPCAFEWEISEDPGRRKTKGGRDGRPDESSDEEKQVETGQRHS